MSWLDKQVKIAIDSKANDKIKELDKTLNSVKDLELSLNKKINEYDNIIDGYKLTLDELKDKSISNFTTNDNILLEKVVEELALKKDKTADDWFYLGLEYQKEKEFEESSKAYEKAIELGSTEPATYNNLAQTYAQINKPNKALKSYKKAIELNPKHTYYINLFEAFLLNNIEVENTFLEDYNQKFANNTQYNYILEMLEILKDIKNSKNVDDKLITWQINYEDKILELWSFHELKEWAKKENDLNIKNELIDTIEVFESYQPNNKTIHNAIYNALNKIGKTSTVKEIRSYVTEHNLYKFGAKEENINNIIRTQIERKSINSNYTNTTKEKLFFKEDSTNKYGLLEWKK